MKYVLLTEKEFELYEKMVNEGKIGKFLNAGRGAIGKTTVFGIKRYVDGMAYTNLLNPMRSILTNSRSQARTL